MYRKLVYIQEEEKLAEADLGMRLAVAAAVARPTDNRRKHRKAQASRAADSDRAYLDLNPRRRLSAPFCWIRLDLWLVFGDALVVPWGREGPRALPLQSPASFLSITELQFARDTPPPNIQPAGDRQIVPRHRCSVVSNPTKIMGFCLTQKSGLGFHRIQAKPVMGWENRDARTNPWLTLSYVPTQEG
ncbi:hypothetical protein I7I51_05999 [Histoplasma capsulatum]|uniref:Uncharacterized protein n=1 Tax=Ajellomyces capsulatus TaxID=5037 RepID=A0A8A1MM49_AJECA|nr:hypothetical protein I7I51_05999 [Histoplasma capsulatum]